MQYLVMEGIILFKYIRKSYILISQNAAYNLVPEAGVEPAPCCQDWILSPARLPIPSFRRCSFILS